MRFNCLIFFFGGCLLSACTGTTSVNYRYPSHEGAEVIPIPEIQDTSLIRYSELFSCVEYIPLEMTGKSAIGNVSELTVTEDGDYIVFDNPNDILCRFSPDGKFLNTIGVKGRNNNEYIDIADYAYDPFHNQVIIWDNPRHTLLYYDIDGRYIKNVEIQWWFGELEVFDQDHLVFFLGEVNEKDRQLKDYHYVITTMEGNDVVVDIPDPDLKLRNSEAFNFKSFSSGFWNTHTVQTEYSPIVYELSDSTLAPRYYFSLGESGIPEKWFGLTKADFRKNLHRHSTIGYLNDFFQTEDYFIITISRPFVYLMICEKNSEYKWIYGAWAINDMINSTVISDRRFFFPGSVCPLTACDNYCYFVCDPSGFENFQKYFDENSFTVTSVKDDALRSLITQELQDFNSFAENGNPVLVKCTLK